MSESIETVLEFNSVVEAGGLGNYTCMSLSVLSQVICGESNLEKMLILSKRQGLVSVVWYTNFAIYSVNDTYRGQVTLSGLDSIAKVQSVCKSVGNSSPK